MAQVQITVMLASTSGRKNPNTPKAQMSGKWPAGTVMLDNPITSFVIPRVKAECSFNQAMTNITFGPPEEADMIDSKTKQTFQTGQVPVMKAKQLIGYVWLELSYQIVLHTQMWKLWAAEEKKLKRKTMKEKAATLCQNSSAVVTQYTLARLMAVDELVAWRHETSEAGKERVAPAGAKFLKADPIRVENRVFFKSEWNVDPKGRELFYPPEDLEDWFDREVQGLKEAFHEMIKKEALKLVTKLDEYSEHHFDARAKLPERWHKGQLPTPYFWSAQLWNWLTKGNSMWEMPMDFLFCVLKEEPSVENYGEFLNQDSCHATHRTSEKSDPANVFNTLEAQLVLQGFVWRHHKALTNEPWNVTDTIRWQSLSRVTPKNMKKYKSGWEWIVSQIALGKSIRLVLKEAGPWWAKKKLADKHNQAQNNQGGVANENIQQAASDPADMNMEEDDHPVPSKLSHQNVEEPQSTMDQTSQQTDIDMENTTPPPPPPPPPPLPPQEDEGDGHINDQDVDLDVHMTVKDDILKEGKTVDQLCECLWSEFLRHRSIDRYENQMKTHLLSHYVVQVEVYTNSLRQWNIRNGAPPHEAYKTFLEEMHPPSSSTTPVVHKPLLLLLPSGRDFNMSAEHKAALEYFKEFLQHRSVDEYQAQLEAHYSSDYDAVIMVHIESLRALEGRQDSTPDAVFHIFIHALTAVATR
ncbi:hypothetical protein BDR06DRAFT_1062616 [Suillus hirtellus]|nr:hypothetical protein BDR06DRAFT_1062616 [Suillus hirtellus]